MSTSAEQPASSASDQTAAPSPSAGFSLGLTPMIGIGVASLLAAITIGGVVLYYRKREEERRQAEEARRVNFLYTFLPLVIFAASLAGCMLVYVKDPSLFGLIGGAGAGGRGGSLLKSAEDMLPPQLKSVIAAGGDATDAAESKAEAAKDKFAAGITGALARGPDGHIFSARTRFFVGFAAGIATILFLRREYFMQNNKMASSGA